MAGDPRSTQRFARIRQRWYHWGATNNTPCARCGQPIDYTQTGNHPQAPNLGHIIEIDRGINPYDETNMQLEHARCNASAGATYGNRKRRNTRPQSRRW